MNICVKLNKSDLDSFLSGSEPLVLKVVVDHLLDEDRKVVVTPEEAIEYLKGCYSLFLRGILAYFHQRWPNEDVWPPGTVLPKGLEHLFLQGGSLHPGTVLPVGLKNLNLGGDTLPSGTVLPVRLTYLSLVGGTLPPGTILPNGLKYLSLGGGTLPPGTILPEGLKHLYLGGCTLHVDINIPVGTHVIS